MPISQAIFMFVNGSLTIGLLAVIAYYARSPVIFPSLGPTAFLLFYRPMASSSSPRNTFWGHLLAIIMGMGSLAIFGLISEPAVLTEGISAKRIGAAALSLGGTGAAMIATDTAHPPAGATTLIISLGLMSHPWQMPILMAAVIVMILQGLIINRLAGIPYPLWRAKNTTP